LLPARPWQRYPGQTFAILSFRLLICLRFSVADSSSWSAALLLDWVNSTLVFSPCSRSALSCSAILFSSADSSISFLRRSLTPLNRKSNILHFGYILRKRQFDTLQMPYQKFPKNISI
jgi:hypothetical protein